MNYCVTVCHWCSGEDKFISQSECELSDQSDCTFRIVLAGECVYKVLRTWTSQDNLVNRVKRQVHRLSSILRFFENDRTW